MRAVGECQSENAQESPADVGTGKKKDINDKIANGAEDRKMNHDPRSHDDKIRTDNGFQA